MEGNEAMIAILNYGLGNLMSVVGALEKIGCEFIVTNRVADLERADKMILPGVGAFADGMKNLRGLGLVEPLTRLVLEEKKPILGICLGFQLMARESFEFGHHRGLGWIDASVIRIDTNGGALRVPHVGWNDFFRIRETPLTDGIPEGALFYYVHSYHVGCDDPGIAIGHCDYGIRFIAAVQQRNIFGTQFHPEKSQLSGLMILKNFAEKA